MTGTSARNRPGAHLWDKSTVRRALPPAVDSLARPSRRSATANAGANATPRRRCVGPRTSRHVTSRHWPTDGPVLGRSPHADEDPLSQPWWCLGLERRWGRWAHVGGRTTGNWVLVLDRLAMSHWGCNPQEPDLEP